MPCARVSWAEALSSEGAREPVPGKGGSSIYGAGGWTGVGGSMDVDHGRGAGRELSGHSRIVSVNLFDLGDNDDQPDTAEPPGVMHFSTHMTSYRLHEDFLWGGNV